MADANDVLFDYVTHGNPSSTEHTNRYLRRYPQFRQEIIELAALWRAVSTIDLLLGEHGCSSVAGDRFAKSKGRAVGHFPRRAETVDA
jgi:hypothetical protein